MDATEWKRHTYNPYDGISAKSNGYLNGSVVILLGCTSGFTSWLGVVALVDGVFGCQPDAVVGPGFEVSLYVKIVF